MALTLGKKEQVVDEVAQVASSAHSAVAAEYRGLTAGELDSLRAKARETGVYLRVVKNTLARRAVAGTGFECMKEQLVGPLMLAFSREDPSSAARLIRDFAKSNDKMVVKLVAVGGQRLDPSEISRLANLPSREEALGKLMAVMMAPLGRLGYTLKEIPGKLVRTLAAVHASKAA